MSMPEDPAPQKAARIQRKQQSMALDLEIEKEEDRIEELTQKLQNCIVHDGKRDDIRELLRNDADPNRGFEYKLGPKDFKGNSLTLAVKKDRLDLVRLLVDYGVKPDSEYSMRAGRLGVLWKGPAVAGTVAKGNIAMMRLLVECQAMLNGRVVSFDGQPNVTLLYDACYFGHAHLVRYLIERRGELDTPVHFQDDMSITFTPLHIASKQGRTEVVKVLLASKAKIDAARTIGGDEQDFSMPIEVKDAIDGGHVDVVWLLLKHGADMFCLQEGPSQRGMDYLFETNNEVMIAAAAQGLKDGESKYVGGLTVADFIQFIQSPNAEVVIQAIFRQVELRYWKQNQRFAYKTAYILNGVINSAVGPSADHFDELFHKNMTQSKLSLKKQKSTIASLAGIETPESMDDIFYDTLLPFRTEKLEGKSQVPVEICQCTLPGLHRSPEVLWVLAEGKNFQVFDELGSRAIVDLGWGECQRAHLRSLCMDMLAMIALAIVAFMLRDESVGKKKPDWEPVRWLCIVALAFTTLRTMLLEALECYGFHLHGKLGWYVLQSDTALDWSRSMLVMLSWVGFAFLDFKDPAAATEDDFHTDGSSFIMLAYRLVMALAGLLGWLQVLSDMKGFEITGKPMLPILGAVGSSGPFGLVMVTGLAGFVHAYYALGIKDMRDAFLIIYRLGFLADFDRFEIGEPQDPIDENPCETPDVTHTRMAFADIILLVSSLTLTIVFMNILIGVLSESYMRAWVHRERLFMRERARIVLHHFSMQLGWKNVRSCCKRRSPSIDGDDDTESQPQSRDSRDFVWYVRRKQMDTHFEDSGESDSMILEGLREMRREMADMHDEIMQRQSAIEEQVCEKLADVKERFSSVTPGSPQQRRSYSSTSMMPEQGDADDVPIPVPQLVDSESLHAEGSIMEFQPVLPFSVPSVESGGQEGVEGRMTLR